ncbi:MAG: carboxypeptidase regulatory-like domain-containing protein, partial [Caldilineaceae bacterium]|nr:carboxypeptidase regulatory-like domain-containing protein [Caldilineaceae bacterium]
LDSNHDGDWADGFTCVDEAGQNKEVVEHILIDYPVDVAALGAGLQTLNNIATERVGWPAQGADAARWVRFTLSEEPSNKPLNYSGIVYGDGRGYATPFRTGETEDYLWVLEGAQANGPDVALQLQGQIVPAQGGHEVRLKFDYANVGTVAINGATLTLSKNVLNVESIIRSVQGPGLHEGDVSVNGDKIVVNLPALAPNGSSSVAMRLGLPASPVRSAAANDAYTVTAQIDLAGDINLRNNRASTALILPRGPLRLAAGVEGDNLPRKADTTCRDELQLQGRGEPFADVDIYVNDVNNVRIQPDADGRITDLRVTNLPTGRSQIWLNYTGTTARPGQVPPRQAVRLVVDDSLPVDPISLLLIDSQGRQFHPNTLGWTNGGDQIDQWPLQEGETYTIQIDVCVGDPNLRMRYELENVFVSSLYDDDGDGTYVGSFVYNRPAQAAAATSVDAGDTVELIVESGGVERRFAAEAVPMTQGTIHNGVDSQRVAAAQVSALVGNGDGFSAIGSTESSAPDAQQTGADGGYGFQVADGTYRLQVEANGYQPYRSGDITVDNGVLATDINLSPAIAAVANH